MIAGMYDVEDEVYYYTNNFVDFYDKNKNKIPEEELKEWAMFLNSPWREKGEKYVVLYAELPCIVRFRSHGNFYVTYFCNKSNIKRK